MENVIKINQMSTEISGSLSIEFMGVGLGSCLVLLYIPVKVDHLCVIALAVRFSHLVEGWKEIWTGITGKSENHQEVYIQIQLT